MKLLRSPIAPSSDAQQRHLRLGDLRDELRSRGVRVKLTRPHHAPWSLTVRTGVLPWRRTTVMCAGADGVFSFLTTTGDILGPAEPDDLPKVATALISMAGAPRR